MSHPATPPGTTRATATSQAGPKVEWTDPDKKQEKYVRVKDESK